VNLLVLGPQGAGKGTQAKRISAEYEIPHIATGDMFRAELAARTPLGKQVGEIMARGDLVPDALTVEMIEKRLSEPDATDGFVLDGFPRNVAQAEALDSMLGGIGRVLSRAALEGRADDTREVIARRLEIYHRETEPIVEHYRMTGKLIPLHADRSIEQVWSEISNALQQVVAA